MKLIKKLRFLKLVNRKKSLLLIFFFFGIFSIQSQAPEFVKNVSGYTFSDFTEYNNKSYFISNDKDLWVTDGSTANTEFISTLTTGFSYIKSVHLGKMFIETSAGELWISDGTTTGTKVLKTGFKDIYNDFVKVDNLLFFKAAIKSVTNTNATNIEWWVTDGTALGTKMIKDINPGDFGQDSPTNYIVYRNKLYFFGYSESGGRDFWVTDGTEAGTSILAESDYLGTILLDYDLITYKDKIYFTFHNRALGIELWESDGTASGTKLFKDCNPGRDSFNLGLSGWPSSFVIINNKLLFFAYNPNDNSGRKYLWSSDGTATNTIPIKKLWNIATTSTEWTMYNNLLYFKAVNDDSGEELWLTDGTETGTKLVKDINTGPQNSSIDKITVVNNKIIFNAFESTNGNELWVSDGTTLGTTLLKDLYPGNRSSRNYDSIFTVGNKAYLIAKTGLNNYQLIETDASTNGTKVITPLDATNTSSPLGAGTISNKLYRNFGMLFFNAKFTTDGSALYKLGIRTLSSDLKLVHDPFLIYPNPASTTFNLKYLGNNQIDKIIITDLSGKKILEQTQNTNQVDVQNLTTGIYIVEAYSGKDKFQTKFVKE